MKFGLGYLTGEVREEETRTDYGRWREVIELTRLAERVGFDSVWLSESHGDANRTISSTLTMCAAVAEATEKVTIGTGVVLAPFHNPLRLAEDAATVDVISGGRFQLGMAIGYRDYEFDRYFQIPKSERVPRLVDCVEVCRRGWTGDTFSYDGEVFSYEDIRVVPKPFQGRNLPILLGGWVEPAVRRAARLGDGLMLGHTLGVEGLKSYTHWIEDEGVDLRDFTLCVSGECSVAETTERARQLVEGPARYSHEKYFKIFNECSDDVSMPHPDEGQPWVIYGTPEEVASAIAPYGEVLGPEDHFLAWIDHPGMEYDLVTEIVERFGREVIPRVKDRL